MTVKIAETIDIDNNKVEEKQNTNFSVDIPSSIDVSSSEVPKEDGEDWISMLHNFTMAHLQDIASRNHDSISEIERSASRLDKLDNIISRVIRADVSCEITERDISRIDSLRSNIYRTKANIVTASAPSYCNSGKHDWVDITDKMEKMTQSEHSDSERQMVCRRCLKIRSFPAGYFHEDESADAVANCNDCGNILYKNASGSIECISCNKLVKTATPRSNSRFVTDPFLHALAKDIINAKVSSGYSLEDCVKKAESDFGLTKREQFLLRKTIDDMGLTVGQMVWLAPAQTTYASVKNMMRKNATENYFVNDNLEINTSFPEHILSEIERTLYESGVDLDDLERRGITSRKELLEEINSRLDVSEIDPDTANVNPIDDYRIEKGLETDPGEPPVVNVDEGHAENIVPEIAGRLLEESDASPEQSYDEAYSEEFTTWRSSVKGLMESKFGEGRGEDIFIMVQDLADAKDLREMFDEDASPADAASELMATFRYVMNMDSEEYDLLSEFDDLEVA